MRQNTINSWYYINSLWNKWIIDTIYRANSPVNLNKDGASSMERKCHRRYYINILVYGYLSFNLQERLVIDKSGSRLMGKNIINRFYLFSYHNTSNIPNLSNPSKFELSISNEMWQHVFISGVGSYIFTFLGYVPGLYFVSSRMWQLYTYFEEGKV